MFLYLPVALTSINTLIILGVGLSIGLLSGLFGVGGGFLITPILMMLGISPTVAAASGANQMVAASASGTYTHWKMGHVDIKMGAFLLAGSFLGGFLGVYAIAALKAVGNADFIIKLTYVLVPTTVGTYMFVESMQSLKRKKLSGIEDNAPKKESALKRFLKSLPYQIDFEKSGVRHSFLLPIIIGILVGVLAAIMGVGGGFIMVPIMLYLLDMPILVVVGTSLFQILFTVIEVTFLSAYTNHTVDFTLALIMLIGSSIGAQLGTIASKKMNADKLKILLAILILGIGIKVLSELTLRPPIRLTF
ncbi:MAG: sulfite exporter TauE/SafE family protein [Actinomycetota bacterium]|nr:sulfite exporter TauE/SafE family protein [Actinomycetota bacterium]